MLDHHRDFIDSVRADRHAAALRARPPADPGELERFLSSTAAPGERGQSVIQRLTARIRTVARGHRLPPHHVDDVVQNTWLRLLEHREDIREPRALGAWLQTTARHECLRVLRDGARSHPVEPAAIADHAEEPDLHIGAEAAERRDALLQAIEALPRRQRQLMLALIAEPEPTYAEIARALDMPIGSIGPTRARALERLRGDRRLANIVAEPGRP
jgi:RNA polymerase sigma factor (sigma-70 family)